MMTDRAPDNLPIFAIRDALLTHLRETPRLVLSAPTGSGKSTQVPQFLLDAGVANHIVILQPRRLAARMLARRVARERGSRLGGEVGYQVRFDHCCGRDTRIVYQTDGIALRRMIDDPLLQGTDVLIFDEFHERHLYGDIMLAAARRLRSRRPDLQLIVMSATLESDAVAAYLDAPVLHTEGRQFPVDIEYISAPPSGRGQGVWDTACRAFERATRHGSDGDVLIFMPGAYEIRRTVDALRRSPAAKGARILPLYGDLAAADQDAAMELYPERKIVVATNVAETSLTIPGIRLVIDSGLARKAGYDANRGIGTLLIETISRASADQRAGRAGRTSPGRCIRLWSEREHAGRPLSEDPEICRVDLSEMVLLLRSLGVEDIAGFGWLDPPPEASRLRADALLTDLGALTPSDRRVTPTGRRMLAFPLHPRYARMLLEAEQRNCVEEACLAAALTQDRGILLPRQNRDTRERLLALAGDAPRSDLVVLMRAWQFAHRHNYAIDACDEYGIRATAARRTEHVFEQFLSTARSVGLRAAPSAGEPDPAALEHCVLVGFADHVARRIGSGNRRCELVHGRRGTLDEDSVARGNLLVASEIQEIAVGRGEVDVRLSLATSIELAWLRELFGAEVETRREVAYDAPGKRVTARCDLVFRGLVIERGRMQSPSPDEAAAVLAAEVLKGNLALKEWNHAVDQWIARVNALAAAWPELGLPAMDAAARQGVIEHICHGAAGYKDIRTRPVLPVVRAWLSPAQQDLVERYAPTRVTLPNGRTPRVTYEDQQPPHIALRTQELYDVDAPVTIADGRLRVLVHVLAPNQRVVQITDDLASFWRDGYPLVKKELRGRYPKHEWR